MRAPGPPVASAVGLTVLALASVAACAYLLGVSEALNDAQEPSVARRLQAAIVSGHRVIRWGPRQTAALILSVLVSLTSSLDRECGASLYVVLFAVLLNMPFRRAAAMTAFTVALGALGPGIASMSEPRLTERGVLALTDYPGALVLLPTMFWGISFGAIVNLWFPNWLLALMWVAAMLGSNIELAISFVRYLAVKKEARTIAAQLRLVSPPASGPGHTPTPPAAPAGVGTGTAAAASGSIELASAAAAAGAGAAAAIGSSPGGVPAGVAGMSRGDVMRERGELMDRAQQLAKRAHRIEARALLYPTLYVPDVGKALQKANIDPNPCGLRVTATPSCLGAMDFEQERLTGELRDYQQVFGRFAFSWGKWWHLNRFHFELALVLKIVVLHLVTEAVRHHTSKPCSDRFWIMLIGMTGVVTAFLMFSVVCYGRRRLWRGPHWVDALDQVRLIKKEQQARELQELQHKAGATDATDAFSGLGLGASPNGPAAAASAAAGRGSSGSVSAAAAATAAGDAITVDLSSSNGGSHDGAALVPHVAATAGSSPAVAQQQQQQQQQEGAGEAGPGGEQQAQQVGCWGRFKQKLPWVWVTGPEAVSNISYCNSRNQYQSWQLPLILLCAAVTLPVGIFGCALGLPGGPIMAHMLLALGLKPEVVAGTSRFLVLCFTFGSFVAHIIAGGLEPTLAAAFGLLNLALAPIGMFLMTKIQPRGVYVIGFSLFMGVTGLVVVAVWQLVPLMAAEAYAVRTGDHMHTPLHIGYGQGVTGSLLGMGNTFELNRFCKKQH